MLFWHLLRREFESAPSHTQLLGDFENIKPSAIKGVKSKYFVSKHNSIDSSTRQRDFCRLVDANSMTKHNRTVRRIKASWAALPSSCVMPAGQTTRYPQQCLAPRKDGVPIPPNTRNPLGFLYNCMKCNTSLLLRNNAVGHLYSNTNLRPNVWSTSDAPASLSISKNCTLLVLHYIYKRPRSSYLTSHCGGRSGGRGSFGDRRWCGRCWRGRCWRGRARSGWQNMTRDERQGGLIRLK